MCKVWARHSLVSTCSTATELSEKRRHEKQGGGICRLNGALKENANQVFRIVVNNRVFHIAECGVALEEFHVLPTLNSTHRHIDHGG